MIHVDAYRHQYGVGQGNFHIQEIAFSGANVKPFTYRFVYDCGGYPKAIDWCVKHAAPGPDRLNIDAVYLSHFESDHVNGLAALCALADIDRIYVPHLDKAMAAHIIAMQIASSGSWTVELQDFVRTVVAAATGGPINDVPVTQIQGGDRPQNPSLERPQPLPDPNAELEISLNAPTGNTAQHSERATIGAMSANGTVRVELWELVHWYYAADNALSAAILAALVAALPTFAADAEPGLQLNATLIETNKALTWFQSNFKAVATVYVQAMDAHNAARNAAGLPSIPKDHNVASLCLYSGPLPKFLKPLRYSVYPRPTANLGAWMRGVYRYPATSEPHYRSAWLATGDAMLKKTYIWTDFEKHFGPVRLDGCLTVQIPHHGADAPSSYNYNPLLIRTYQNCVISAGAKSNHGHPHKDVVKDILTKPAVLRLVNETDHLGFIEHLKFQYD